MILSTLLLNQNLTDKETLCDCKDNANCSTCKVNAINKEISLPLAIFIFILEIVVLFYAFKLAMSCNKPVTKFFNFLFALMSPLLYIIVRLILFPEC